MGVPRAEGPYRGVFSQSIEKKISKRYFIQLSFTRYATTFEYNKYWDAVNGAT